MIIKRFGLTKTLISFPVLMLVCTIFVWIWPNIWVVFAVMMVMKGMSYALNNPTKEILYQMTNTAIKFKCKSWIDTFGQRSAKAGGSLITNAFASSIVDLTLYGSLFGVAISVLMIWVSDFMGKAFEELSAKGEKIGEQTQEQMMAMAAQQAQQEDTSCGHDEEGQSPTDAKGSVELIDKK
jgi:AAA family ATP:ADP antiporter